MQDAQLRDTIQARTIELIGHFVPLKAKGSSMWARVRFTTIRVPPCL